MIKVLYFGDLSAGAMGIINRDIKKIIDRDYSDINFELMDWANPDMYFRLFNQKEWKNWDLIIIDPYLASILDKGWLFKDLPKNEQLELKNKFIPVYHHEVDVPADHFNHGWYEGWFTTPVCSINPYIVNQIKQRGVESQLLPIGVSKEKFKPFKEVKEIKKVGIVRYYDKVKTFNTISEAVDIINYFNESDKNIKKYVNELHTQMLPERYWENILAKYWVPYFNKMYKSKIEKPQWPVPQELDRWYNEKGDYTHNIDCDLTKDSVVFDVGGYAGEWAEQIYNKYNCNIYVFEPVKEFYDNIVKRFNGNDKVKVFHIGLGNKTYNTNINLTADLVGTSVHRETGITGKVESIKIVDIIEFIKEHKLETIDLLKLNIEGEEFPLLEHLIENNKLNLFKNLKIQFHNFMESAKERKHYIRTQLKKEFNIVYDFFFVWEGWKIKT